MELQKMGANTREKWVLPNNETKSSVEEETAVLAELGLTLSEAKVYLTLAQIGPSRTGSISKATGIQRQHVYHSLHSLEEKGLIEKQLGKIANFKAVPLDRALGMLVKRKQKQISQLKTKTETIIENFRKQNTSQHASTIGLHENAPFTITPGNEFFVEKLKEAVQKTQVSLAVVTTQKRFSPAILEFAEAYKEALERDVKIMIATEKHEPETAALEVVRGLMKTSDFEVKYFTGPSQAIVTIIDGKQAMVTLSATAPLMGTASLWSTNTCFVALAQSYFESKWNNSR